MLVLLHRYVGLALGLFLLVSGATGSAIVFGKAIDALLNADLLTVTPQARRAGIDRVLRNAQLIMPEQKAGAIQLPASPVESVSVLFPTTGERVYVDPYTAQVLGKRDPDGSLTGFLTDLHVHLLAGKTGERVLGWAGVGGIVLLLAGLILWWPKRGRWKHAFAIKRGASGFRTWFDIHRVAGACACGLLLMTLVTGSALALFDIVMEPALIALTGKGARQPAPKSGPGARRTSLDPMLAQAAALYPDGRITRITLPAKADGAVAVRMRLNGEVHQFGRTFIWFDQYDGRLLRVDDALTAHRAVQIQSWLFPLHTGFYGGNFTKWLQVLAGLALSLLTLSGAWLWWKKFIARSRPTMRYAAAPQSAE